MCIHLQRQKIENLEQLQQFFIIIIVHLISFIIYLKFQMQRRSHDKTILPSVVKFESNQTRGRNKTFDFAQQEN